jgi:short-subunit dehydrogenase
MRIWITGASSGIGRAMTMAAARRGMQVVISARRREVLDAVRQETGRPDAVAVVTLDQDDPEACAARAVEAWSAFGGLDVIVLNGGLSQRAKAIDTAFDVDRRLMTVDYLANVAMIKALLPQIVAAGASNPVRIGVVTSLVGVIGSPYRTAYAAAKHALHGFFDSLRAELPESVSVTLVCPGFVRTDVSVNALTGDGSPLGEMDRAQAQGLDPADVARSALDAILAGRREIYLAGPEGRAIWLKRWAPGLLARMLRRAQVR